MAFIIMKNDSPEYCFAGPRSSALEKMDSMARAHHDKHASHWLLQKEMHGYKGEESYDYYRRIVVWHLVEVPLGGPLGDGPLGISDAESEIRLEGGFVGDHLRD